MQIETALRERVDDLALIAEQLENDIAVNTPIDPGTPTAGALGRGDFRNAPSILPDDFNLAISNSLATMEQVHQPSARLGMQKKSHVRGARPRVVAMIVSLIHLGLGWCDT